MLAVAEKRKLEKDEKKKSAPSPTRRVLDTKRPSMPEDIAKLASEHDVRTPMVAKLEAENPEFHYAFMDPQTPDYTHVAKGYEPVTTGDGDQIRAGQDPLYRIPKDEFLRRRRAASALSRAAISESQREAQMGGVDWDKETAYSS